MASTFCWLLVWPQTTAPRPLASWTTREPTPPDAPSTTTRSWAVTGATSSTSRQAVAPATGIVAACAGSTSAGSGIRADSGTAASSR